MRNRKDLIKFFIKCMVIVVICSLFSSLCIYTDIFNVFHPNSIRKTHAEIAKHFLKMKYLVANPEKFDAFIFGSSRVGYIPTSYLNDNTALRWYNMTYSMGCPEEHYSNLRMLVESGASIKKIIVGIDNISMCEHAELHTHQLERKPYKEYLQLGWRFYLPYLFRFNFGILKDVLKGEKKTDLFYEDGSRIGEDISLPPAENKDHKSSANPNAIHSDTALSDIRAIKDFCNEHDIEILFVANPIWKWTYIDACKDNYLDFLYDVAQITPFINFSCLNEITTDGRNYYEGSHFRPNVGLLMLEILCGNSDRAEELASSQFGVLVTQDNVDSIIASLRAQLDSF